MFYNYYSFLFQIFNFELSKDEMESIFSLNKNKRLYSEEM